MEINRDVQHDTNILFVEDDAFFREATTQNLRDAGFNVIGFDQGESALKYFQEGGVAHLALLDWKLANTSGIDLFRQLREQNVEVPTIFLTSLTDSIYEEVALKSGAADFIDKARSFTILLSRINSALSRLNGGAKSIKLNESQEALLIGNLTLYTTSSRAYWKSQLINLTVAEFRIVHQMALRADQDLSHRKIYDTVRGSGFIAGDGREGYRTNVRTFIKRIRQKFCAVDSEFNRIATYSGFGYRWLSEQDKDSTSLH